MIEERIYRLLKEDSIIINGRKLFRIEAIKDSLHAKKGEVGGYIESAKNLRGNAWVSESGVVFEEAQVYGNALIRGGKVFGRAIVKDDAIIDEEAQVYGNAKVFQKARIRGNAHVFDDTKIYGDVRIYGNARVYGKAELKYGEFTGDIRKDFVEYIACSLGVYPNPKTKTYILYKRVNKIKNGVYCSLFDKEFIYEDGKIAIVDNYDSDFFTSCSDSIHVSTPFYWNTGDTLIAVEVHLDDIITCMEGKIRAKKVKTLGEVKSYKE